MNHRLLRLKKNIRATKLMLLASGLVVAVCTLVTVMNSGLHAIVVAFGSLIHTA